MDETAFKILISRAAGEARQGLEHQGGANSPVVKLADVLLERAIERRASDLHLEPQTDFLRVRYRIDGLLQIEDNVLPKEVESILIARLKVMAGMDTAKHQCPQDGHIEFASEGRQIDIRVSVLPAIHGELMVLRFMNVEEKILNLGELGFSDKNMELFRGIIEKPSGLVILSGPVNSGKTTSLYAALQALNKPESNLVTLENPVERVVPGINQVEINPKSGLNYMAGLKALLRQDITAVMVGEIRDGEVASYIVRIALTGHLIMTTLHTENAVGVIFRLREMNIPPYMIAATLTGAVAQRLVRKSCPHCQEEYEPAANSAEAQMLGERWHRGLHLKRNTGCPHCRGTGYSGRLALQEVLVISPAVREAILMSADRDRLQALAEREGLRTLWQDGVDKVLDGKTTLSELKRVI
ncbi:MAG: type II/IV secretion system protein [Selenomonas sp.]|nr:type II/IV secretion system protein [Selenomonas sp.]